MSRRDQYGDPEDYEDPLFRQPMPPELIVALLLGALLLLGGAIIVGWRLVAFRAA